MGRTGSSVRIFTGRITSDIEETGPAVVVLSSDLSGIQCRFIFFTGHSEVMIHLEVDGATEEGILRVKGSARDPRGWDVTFAAVIRGDTILGQYQQPNDQGKFMLKEKG